MQLHQVTIAQGTGQVFLDFLAAAVDQAQLLLVHRGGTVQNLVHKAQTLFRAELLHAVDHKILEHRRILRAHRHDHILR